MIGHKNIAVMTIATVLAILPLAGCEKEGPAEKAGKEVDKAMNNVGNQIQAAGDKVQSAVK